MNFPVIVHVVPLFSFLAQSCFAFYLINTALDVMEKCGETGPIQPKHIRDAVRKLRTQGTIVNTKYKKKMF